MIKIVFQGVTGRGTQERIKKEDRKPDKFYYGIRHKDGDMGMPATIEDWVYVNHFADIEMDEELDTSKWHFWDVVKNDRFFRELTISEQQMLMSL